MIAPDDRWWCEDEWDEDEDGPMPDLCWTECPGCGKEFEVWHLTTFYGCDCGRVFDPAGMVPY